MTTVAQALAAARARGVDRLDAALLLAHQLGTSRAWLLAHGDETLPDAAAQAYAAAIARRADGVPLAYLTGVREFRGLALQVGPAVLDPRPDTETLVDWALELLAGPLADTTQAVDLGTGSGAIALALKHACPRLRMHASDASADALAVARANAHRHGLDVTFALGDWWHAWPDQRFSLVVSNPPYIAGDDPHLEALRHEPLAALTPGGDGLGAIEAIADGAPAHLAPGGWLLFEHGHDQGHAVRALLTRHGFVDVQTRRDLAGHERCTGARSPG